MTYAILYNPGHNRVYFDAALKIALSEFKIAVQKLGISCENPENRRIGGIYYLTFETDVRLRESEVAALSRLSFVYALFEMTGSGGKEALIPLEKPGANYIDEGISSIMKYSGKTNELFTRMLINIACFSRNSSGDIRLLDPISGKGTTLYEGLIRGYDVFGVEVGEKVTNEACRFLEKFLQTAKYKFERKTEKISGAGRSFSATKYSFTIARTKEEMKAGQTKRAEFVAGNSQFAASFFKRESFDIIVGDLPYGVQHGNVTNEKQSSLTRNPTELLGACLPPWTEVLKPGGAIALSWNLNVLSRVDMIKIFEREGLAVKDEGPYAELAHRVDQAIVRDVIVAVKPARKTAAS